MSKLCVRVCAWNLNLINFYSGANVHATTATGDTALTYACENGHTDVADVLLQAGANLVCHESCHWPVVLLLMLF